MVVVGTITIKSFSEFNPLCLKIHGMKNIWTLCSEKIEQKQEFFSLMSKLFPEIEMKEKADVLKNENRFRIKDAIETEISKEIQNPNQKNNSNSQYQAKLVKVEDIIEDQPIWLFPNPTPVCNQDWNYRAHGTDWGCKCSEGADQSPITIKRKYDKIRKIPVPAIFDFPIIPIKSFRLSILPNSVKLTCDTTKINMCEDFIMASIIDYDATEYIAYEIIFHFPNEHQIDDETYDMEIQVIYKGVSEGDSRKKAGLSFLIKETPGAKNSFLKKMNVLNIPQSVNQVINLSDNNQAKDISVADLFKYQDNDILTEKAFNYFSYIGSLTNPPCDEPMKWFIVEKAIPMGLADLETLKKSVMQSMETPKEALEDIEGWNDNENFRSKDGNFRQKQELHERWIEYYNRGNLTNTYSLSKNLLF